MSLLQNLVRSTSRKQKLLLIYLPLVFLCAMFVPVSAVREYEGGKQVYDLSYQFLWDIPAYCTPNFSTRDCRSTTASYGVWKTQIDIGKVALEFVALTTTTAFIAVLLDLMEKKT